MEILPKEIVKAAKDFAKEKNRGLSNRIREKLDTIKPGLLVLVNERLTVGDIQEFVRKETGMKIGLKTMQQYCRETFNYPPTKH